VAQLFSLGHLARNFYMIDNKDYKLVVETIEKILQPYGEPGDAKDSARAASKLSRITWLEVREFYKLLTKIATLRQKVEREEKKKKTET
jgi:hypothetical protein